jgi:hypothetical protein
MQRSTRARRPPKPSDAGSTRETTTTAPRDDDDDPKAEVRALDEAWTDIIHDAARDGAELADGSILALLLAAITGTPGEEAEADPPGIAVLRTIRATVRGWSHTGGNSTRGPLVPFVEIDLLTRRLDAAIVLVRRSPGGIQ